MSHGKNLTVGILMYGARQTEFDKRILIQSAQDKWNNFYPDDEELLPSNMPKLIGSSVKIRNSVDAEHSGNLENRRSHIRILIYLNN